MGISLALASSDPDALGQVFPRRLVHPSAVVARDLAAEWAAQWRGSGWCRCPWAYYLSSLKVASTSRSAAFPGLLDCTTAFTSSAKAPAHARMSEEHPLSLASRRCSRAGPGTL